MSRLAAEHDNLRAALVWLTGGTKGNGEGTTTGLQLATDLWRFWWSRAYLSEGRSWLETALTSAPDAKWCIR